MSTIIVITPPPTRPQLAADGEGEDTIIKVKLEGEGSVSSLLRQAADVLDGQQE